MEKINIIKRKAKNIIDNKISIKLSLGLIIINFITMVNYNINENTDSIEQIIIKSFILMIFSNIVLSIFKLNTMWGFFELLQNDKEIYNNTIKKGFKFWELKYIKNTVNLVTIRIFFTFIWTLLFIVPGIIKSYEYSQATLIYANDIKQNNFIKTSKEYLKESSILMKNHKMELFLLDLSFILWVVMNKLTLGLVGIYYIPYYEATKAEFYRNLIKIS